MMGAIPNIIFRNLLGNPYLEVPELKRINHFRFEYIDRPFHLHAFYMCGIDVLQGKYKGVVDCVVLGSCKVSKQVIFT